jgi:hydroxyquinol 1,2-dioxygenase
MMEAHEKGYFTEENSAEVVAGRNANATDPRLKEVMEVIIRHLHAAVKRSSRPRRNGSRRSCS